MIYSIPRALFAYVCCFVLASLAFAFTPYQIPSQKLDRDQPDEPSLMHKAQNQNLLLDTQVAQASTEARKDVPSTPCMRVDFESAVDKAASILRDLNSKNKPHFQDLLKRLRDKKGWSQEVYEKEAARIVKDDEIDKLDGRTADILAQITAMGDQGSTAITPDCSLLQTLQTYMDTLIETQTAKWAYIFKKMDREMELQ